MLLVHTTIGPSPIAGIGLFAAEFIPKGTVVWEFRSGLDLRISRAALASLSEAARQQVLNYAYLNTETDTYILCFDDSRFTNHSETPSCTEQPVQGAEAGLTIAARDIQIGEELTEDYRLFDGDTARKLTRKP